MKDEVPCAVLCRSKPSSEWDLAYYTKLISHAWRLQVWIDAEEHKKNPRHQTITVLRDNYDMGRIRVLKVPRGFDPDSVPRSEPEERKLPPLPPLPAPVAAEPVVEEIDEFALPPELAAG